MIKVWLEGDEKSKPSLTYKDANICGIHSSGLLLQVSEIVQEGTGFQKERQVAVANAADVVRVEVEDAPEIVTARS